MKTHENFLKTLKNTMKNPKNLFKILKNATKTLKTTLETLKIPPNLKNSHFPTVMLMIKRFFGGKNPWRFPLLYPVSCGK
jgi:hypothetical protein